VIPAASQCDRTICGPPALERSRTTTRRLRHAEKLATGVTGPGTYPSLTVTPWDGYALLHLIQLPRDRSGAGILVSPGFGYPLPNSGSLTNVRNQLIADMTGNFPIPLL
jgi:hypothetical protein